MKLTEDINGVISKVDDSVCACGCTLKVKIGDTVSEVIEMNKEHFTNPRFPLLPMCSHELHELRAL